MYKIYADDTLIYDSTVEDYKIGKGSITLEINKSGSFTFSLYPDHFYYDSFVRLKTVITVYKSNKIVFRGRILNDVTDYWNNKVFTCEGELGFLQDSVIRPYAFTGTPAELFVRFVTEHNNQVDQFKRFKIGRITVVDPNDYINRSNTGYESAYSNMNSRLIEDSLGGYFYITHGDDGTDPVPTIHYIEDFTKVSTQAIEFGSNLKNYTKTIKADEIATAIIPLGATVDDGDSETEDPKLTIASVNNGVDYVYSPDGVALYGWIFKTVSWDDVTDPNILKKNAETYVTNAIEQNITIELTAIDLHLLNRSIESISLGEYVPVNSEPHNFHMTLLCNKQTMELLKPDSDTLTLGHSYTTFTETAGKTIQNQVNVISGQISVIKTTATKAYNNAQAAVETVGNENILNLIYPVGSIYMSVNNASPASFLGGTWEQIKDKFLLSAGDSYSAGATGGEATHTLTVDEMPNHRHTFDSAPLLFLEVDTSGDSVIQPNTSGSCTKMTYNTGYTGGGLAHNNMPPYLSVYMWKRIA